MLPNNDKNNNFPDPRDSYRGEVNPSNLIFNDNLQEFAQKINYICALETGGKLPPEMAYKQIKSLWKKLKKVKRNLDI